MQRILRMFVGVQSIGIYTFQDQSTLTKMTTIEVPVHFLMFLLCFTYS